MYVPLFVMWCDVCEKEYISALNFRVPRMKCLCFVLVVFQSFMLLSLVFLFYFFLTLPLLLYHKFVEAIQSFHDTVLYRAYHLSIYYHRFMHSCYIWFFSIRRRLKWIYGYVFLLITMLKNIKLFSSKMFLFPSFLSFYLFLSHSVSRLSISDA